MKNLLKRFLKKSQEKSTESSSHSNEELQSFEAALESTKKEKLQEEGIQTARALVQGKVVQNGNRESASQGLALAAYLKAVKGEQLHIVSINEAVARKRFEALTPLYEALGLSSARLHRQQTPEERQEAYQKDVVFGTAGGFIHDYLKDHKVLDPEDRRQGKHSFAIVEEADLILIDQATRPVGIFGKEDNIIDSITLRSYFSSYSDLAALIETDGGDEQEFADLYEMGMAKMDPGKKSSEAGAYEAPTVYKTLEEKRRAIFQELKKLEGGARPLLVSLRSDEKAELLLEDLENTDLAYRSLLLKDRQDEEEFVKEAMAAEAMMLVVNPVSRGIGEFLPKNTHILCTERYMLKRNDEYLRRMVLNPKVQGSIEFILSLGDDLMDVFSEEDLEQLKDSISTEKGQPINNVKVLETMDYVQKRMKEKNSGLRSYVQHFEAVIQRQREVIYSEREKVLTEEDIKEHILNLMENAIDEEVEKYTAHSMFPEEWDLEGLATALSESFLPKGELVFQDVENLTKKDLKGHLIQKASKAYMQKKKELGKEAFDWMQRVLLLKIIDQKWAEHLEAMEELRQDMNLRALGRQDPVRAFQVEGFQLFENMTRTIPKELIRRLFDVEEAGSEK